VLPMGYLGLGMSNIVHARLLRRYVR
jgi:hypothetical protein